VIRLGKRNQRCALLVAVAAFGISANALAQAPAPVPDAANPPPASPEPATPAEPPAAPPAVVAPPPPAPVVMPEPPKPTYPTVLGGQLVKINDIFSFRPGILLQLWGVLGQDLNPKSNGDAGGFSKQLYMRRARMFLTGGIGSQLSYTILFESGNLGQANTNAATGAVDKGFSQGIAPAGTANPLGIYEAYLDYKFNPNVSIQAGSMLIPFTRNILQSSSTYLQIDIAGVSAQYLAATQTNTLRDTGLQLKINALQNKLEVRAMVSQGMKLADTDDPVAGVTRTAGKNNPRVTGFLQYNFLDGDSGYVFNGQYFGKKRILALAVGADYQNVDTTGDKDNAYFAESATLFAAIPLKGADPAGGDEVAGQFEYVHYHGGGGAPASGLFKRDGYLGELSYYSKAAKLSVFGQFQMISLDGAPEVNKVITNTQIFGGGIKYFLAEQVANLTLQYNYQMWPDAPKTNAEATTAMLPALASRNPTSQLQLQLQLSY
jgi:hypothetical protein